MNKKPVMRAIRLEEALADLTDAEQILSKLENTHVFLAFTERQKRQYHAMLDQLRDMIHDITNDTSQEQLAS